VMPGIINAHTHLYSSLVRGMPGPAKQPKSFIDILKYVWWKLDRALDEEAIYYSALIGSLEAVRCGTTTLIDHHASPNSIPGSLEIIKEAMSNLGIRGVLCYEVTDRDGLKRRDEGLNENVRFISSNRTDSMFRGLVGAHASCTLSDESLRLLGEIAQYNGTGVHIHVAEATDDLILTKKKYKQGILERFAKNNIPGEHSIFAHAVHLTSKELKQVRATKTWLIHNPRSNMNNQVGYASLQNFGSRAALGTDGFPADMFEEASVGYYKLKDAKAKIDGSMPVTLLNTGQKLVSQIFGKKFGALNSGSVADIVIFDYRPPTPLTKENLPWHFLFGMKASMVESVMIEGRLVVKNRSVVGLDIEEIVKKSSVVAKRIWERYQKIV
jgi:putative selenium metabolism protein SsnA